MELYLIDIIPDYKQLEIISTEEIAFAALKVLESKNRGVGLYSFCSDCMYDIHHKGYQINNRQLQEKIELIISEAWSWLKRECLIVQDTGLNPTFYYVSRKGKELLKSLDFESYKKASQFPDNLIHERIRNECRLNFFRGAYDTAVFEAFKEVELAVREASNLPNNLLGTKLMRKAFEPEKGILTDRNLESGEQHAMGDLFAGAIGYCKNPQSHRDVGLGFSGAIELILLASHLIKIVENRSTPTTTSE